MCCSPSVFTAREEPRPGKGLTGECVKRKLEDEDREDPLTVFFSAGDGDSGESAYLVGGWGCQSTATPR